MRLFHTTTYELYNKDDIKLCIISDIHFSKIVKDKKLNHILKYMKKVNPSYILIPGDFIDSTNEIEDELEKKRFLNWLKKLSNISKVIISIGNHDVTKTVGKKELYDYKKDFFDEINKIDNIYLLNNDIYEDKYIRICGITITFDCYFSEDKKVLLENLEKNKLLLQKANKLNILMIHSPINLNDKEVEEKIKCFDFYISGHMHNGCIPPIVNEVWKSTRGIITPTKKLFKKNTRNSLTKKGDKLLISGPVITFSKKSGFVKNFDFIYPMYISIMNFNKNNDFNIKRKYHK